MKTDVMKSSVKIWFGFLKMAIELGIPINRTVYDSWGSIDELRSLSFNKWWLTRGRALFEKAKPLAQVVDATDEFVTIKIPTSLNSKQVKEQVSRVMTLERGTKRLKKKSPLGFDGDMKYKTLKQYERFLEVDLDPETGGKTLDEKSLVLRGKYEKIRKTAETRKKTLREKKNYRAAARVTARNPDDFGDGQMVGFGKDSRIKRGVDSKKASRWLISAKILVLNAAEGRFPGKGYYGAKIGAELRSRLKKLGLADLVTSQRNRGGGRRRAELRLVESRKSKKQREAEGLLAYGAPKARQLSGVQD